MALLSIWLSVLIVVGSWLASECWKLPVVKTLVQCVGVWVLIHKTGNNLACAIERVCSRVSLE